MELVFLSVDVIETLISMNMMSFGVSQVDLFIGDVITCQLAHCDASLCSPSFKSFFHESKHEQDIFVSLLSLVCALVFFYKKKEKKMKKRERERESNNFFCVGTYV